MWRGIICELCGLGDPGKNKLEEGDIEVDIYFCRLRVGSPIAFGYRDPGASAQRTGDLSIRGTVDLSPWEPVPRLPAR